MNRNAKSRVSIQTPLNSADCDGISRRGRAEPGDSPQVDRNPWARTRAAFDKYLKKFENGQHHGFLVIHRDTGGIVGVINLNDVIRGNFQSAFVGYYAFQPYAGRGLMREGLRLVLKHAFHKLKLHRVEANIQPNNRASLALAKSCGFVREGFSRRLVKVCGRWKDHERWAILAGNFPVATRR